MDDEGHSLAPSFKLPVNYSAPPAPPLFSMSYLPEYIFLSYLDNIYLFLSYDSEIKFLDALASLRPIMEIKWLIDIFEIAG